MIKSIKSFLISLFEMCVQVEKSPKFGYNNNKIETPIRKCSYFSVAKKQKKYHIIPLISFIILRSMRIWRCLPTTLYEYTIKFISTQTLMLWKYCVFYQKKKQIESQTPFIHSFILVAWAIKINISLKVKNCETLDKHLKKNRNKKVFFIYFYAMLWWLWRWWWA